MKTSITFFLFLLFFNTLISQNKSQELEGAFDTEMYNFNNAILNAHEGGMNAFVELDTIFKNGKKRALKSQGKYPDLVPSWFGFALKLADKIAPGSEKIGKGVTTLLEIGWKERNDKIEAFRKQTAIDNKIEVRKLVNNWKVEFDMKLSPFLKNGDLPSRFEKKNKDNFNNGTLKEKEQILKEFQEFNKQLKKDYPPFAEENNAKAKKIAKIEVYEAYINHFLDIRGNDLMTYGEGYLIAYLNYDENLNLIHTVIVPRVPSGIEVGSKLNRILGTNKKPLEFKFYKIIYVHVKGKRMLQLTVFPSNFVKYNLINKNNPECKRYEQRLLLTSVQEEFLNEVAVNSGVANRDNCGYWYIKESLFKEFTERNSSSIKNLPNTLKKQLDF